MPQVPEDNEMLRVDMPITERLRLHSQITAQMERLGIKSLDYKKLDLGFELPVDWPVAENAKPTLAELTVVARKLKMKIVISNVYMEPHKPKENKGQ